MLLKIYRCSRPEVVCKKGVLRNFAQLTGKHMCQSLFFNKVAGLRPEEETLTQMFSCEHVWWLLLNIKCTSVVNITDLKDTKKSRTFNNAVELIVSREEN